MPLTKRTLPFLRSPRAEPRPGDLEGFGKHRDRVAIRVLQALRRHHLPSPSQPQPGDAPITAACVLGGVRGGPGQCLAGSPTPTANSCRRRSTSRPSGTWAGTSAPGSGPRRPAGPGGRGAAGAAPGAGDVAGAASASCQEARTPPGRASRSLRRPYATTASCRSMAYTPS